MSYFILSDAVFNDTPVAGSDSSVFIQQAAVTAFTTRASIH